MNVNSQTFDAIVIGAGQAGLAAGWHLRQQGLDFLILDEQQRPGGNWHNYYDSLKLFSPAAYSSLPGMAFPGEAKHYPLRHEVVRYLEDYAKRFQLPIRPNTRVSAVRRDEAGFSVDSADGQHFLTKALIVASGGFSRPYIPSIPGLDSFGGTRLHSAQYRNSAGFEGQRIVVVGAANSAVQIAHELAQVAQVTLASREAIRFMPQRTLGADFHDWLKWTGLGNSRWLSDQSTPVLDDGTYRRALKAGRYSQRPMFQQVTPTGIVWADGQEERIDSLIFATGFRPNLPFLEGLPVMDDRGDVLQRHGIATRVPGLYFVGLPKQRNFASATLRGVGPDIEHNLKHLLRYLQAAPAGVGGAALQS
ncbi:MULTISPECIES: NAD(P)/FAD-dependent oxidoreductase [unclassified Pseudomonas]|uniref:flavin-containing monooxygenase n=1 Tax=unclassified Pseudomonas TaxID=196821 RepID=UPI00244A2B70|nr:MULTISPECIES: NAD(P)/FAD-dependent oxidoreductase [unclassified Pseudomonas]MDH0894973.1 NAD(P)/FAD-dependent oxidoreductase [Pseudomonas sp. GD03875]MDH1063829.1 NAD(P)/FAD-dependent oxidoreductase [Pseudomonas sp. GD03985]